MAFMIVQPVAFCQRVSGPYEIENGFLQFKIVFTSFCIRTSLSFICALQGRRIRKMLLLESKDWERRVANRLLVDYTLAVG